MKFLQIECTSVIRWKLRKETFSTSQRPLPLATALRIATVLTFNSIDIYTRFLLYVHCIIDTFLETSFTPHFMRRIYIFTCGYNLSCSLLNSMSLCESTTIYISTVLLETSGLYPLFRYHELYVFMSTYISLGYIPSSGIVPYDIHIFSCCFRNNFTVLQKDGEHYVEILGTPDVCQPLVFSVCISFWSFWCLEWYGIVVLICVSLMTNEAEHIFMLVPPEFWINWSATST